MKLSGVLVYTAISVVTIYAASPKLKTGYCSAKAPHQKTNNLPVCVKPIGDVAREGPFLEGADGNFLEDIPDWFDPDFGAIGQKFGIKNAFGVYYSMFMIFIFFIGDPYVKKVMINAGHVSTPEGAAKRYLTNLVQTELWMNDDIRGNRTHLLQSLHQVRTRHLVAGYRSKVNDTLLRKPLIPEPKPGQNPKNIDLRIWNAFEADLRASEKLKKYRVVKNAPTDTKNTVLMNQFVMANTHFLHFGLPVILPEKVFIQQYTDTELEAYMHLWAFFGKAVGVEDEYNICLQPDIKTARVYLTKYFYENMVPTLFTLDYEAKVMFEYFFKGLNNAFSRRENERIYEWNNLGDVFLLRLLEDILEIPTPNMRGVLTGFERGTHGILRGLLTRYRGRGYQFGGNLVWERLLRLWSDLKLNLDTRNPSDVAQNGFV